jgi:hypothetical protein
MLGHKIEAGMRVKNLAYFRSVPRDTLGTVLDPVHDPAQACLVRVKWDTGVIASVFQWELQEVRSNAAA